MTGQGWGQRGACSPLLRRTRAEAQRVLFCDIRGVASVASGSFSVTAQMGDHSTWVSSYSLCDPRGPCSKCLEEGGRSYGPG